MRRVGFRQGAFSDFVARDQPEIAQDDAQNLSAGHVRIQHEGGKCAVTKRIDDRARQRRLARSGLAGQQQNAFAAPQSNQQIVVRAPMRRAPEHETRIGGKRKRLFAETVEGLIERLAQIGRRGRRLHESIICYKWHSVKLLYFAPVRWDSYEQRPHYFARYFLDRGGSHVLWVDPYPTRLPSARDLRRLSDRALPPLPRPSGLDVVAVAGLPLEPLAAGRWLNATLVWPRVRARLLEFAKDDDLAIGIGRPSDLALRTLAELKSSWSCYDAMDDFPEFYQGRAKLVQERLQTAIASRVQTVYAASSGLAAKMRVAGLQPVTVANAFDMSSLPRLGARPGRRILGYTGCISHWFDWPLVLDLATSVQDVRVELVGPCASPPPARLPANVTLLPECHHRDAVRHLATWDAGLIPFAVNHLTASVDPIKFYAYRAMGLPVLSTAFGEMVDRAGQPGTWIIRRGSALTAAVETAVASPIDSTAVAQFRREHDWRRRFDDADVFAPISRAGAATFGVCAT